MNCVIALLVIMATEVTLSLPVRGPVALPRVKRDTNDADYKVLCYYVNWSQYRTGNGRYTVDDIDPRLCTHILFAFAKVQGNSLTVYEPNDVTMYQQLQDLKKINPSLKTLLSVGGATSGDAIRKVASDAKNREVFAQNVVLYARKYGFDGVDIDWEFPWAQDKSSFTEMMKEIYFKAAAEAFVTGSDPLLVTCALGAAQSVITQSYDLVNLQKYIDFATVMTYDLHGGWDHVTGFHAAVIGSYPGDVFNQKWVVRKYLSLQFPSNKLILGIPTYGRTYRLCNPAQHGVGQCSKGYGQPGPYTKSAGMLAYNEICEKLNAGWTEAFDAGQRNPYAYKGDQWVGYDDIRTVKAKIEFATQESLGGVMFWDLSMDDFHGRCNEGKYPLISQAKILIDRTTSTTSTTGISSPPPSTSTTAPPRPPTSTTASPPPPTSTTAPPSPPPPPTSTTAAPRPPTSTTASPRPPTSTTAAPRPPTSTTAPPPAPPTSTTAPPSPPTSSTVPPSRPPVTPTKPPSAPTSPVILGTTTHAAPTSTISRTAPTSPVISTTASSTTRRMSTTHPFTTTTTTTTTAPNPTQSTTTVTTRFSTALTISQVPVTCPSLFAFLEHPTDCELFYRCVWGKPMVFRCPRGTYFNLSLPGCDWPSAVFRNCSPVS